ncbi:VN1R4 protein, partial [Crocuta crocuta]
MVFILCVHKPKGEHLYRNNISPRSSPEITATPRILVLGSTFVTFYTLSSTHCTFSLSLDYVDGSEQWSLNQSPLPRCQPFILWSDDHCVSRFFSLWEAKQNTFCPCQSFI